MVSWFRTCHSTNYTKRCIPCYSSWQGEGQPDQIQWDQKRRCRKLASPSPGMKRHCSSCQLPGTAELKEGILWLLPPARWPLGPWEAEPPATQEEHHGKGMINLAPSVSQRSSSRELAAHPARNTCQKEQPASTGKTERRHTLFPLIGHMRVRAHTHTQNLQSVGSYLDDQWVKRQDINLLNINK